MESKGRRGGMDRTEVNFGTIHSTSVRSWIQESVSVFKVRVKSVSNRITDAFYELREMVTDEEIQDIDVWEPATVVKEESPETDDTKADDQWSTIETFMSKYTTETFAVQL